MIEIQKSRVHDIVHGAFIGLNSLIPNPIKSSIRKMIRNHVTGQGTKDIPNTDVGEAIKILDPSNYKQQALKLQEKINKLGKNQIFSYFLVKFKQRNSEDIEDQSINNLIDSNKINRKIIFK